MVTADERDGPLDGRDDNVSDFRSPVQPDRRADETDGDG